MESRPSVGQNDQRRTQKDSTKNTKRLLSLYSPSDVDAERDFGFSTERLSPIRGSDVEFVGSAHGFVVDFILGGDPTREVVDGERS